MKKLNMFIVKAACGYTHALALTEEGNLYGWGTNSYGQLCIDTREDIHNPVLVSHLLIQIVMMQNSKS